MIRRSEACGQGKQHEKRYTSGAFHERVKVIGMNPSSKLGFLVLSFICFGTFFKKVHSAKNGKPTHTLFTNGDFIIGGLSPVHFSPTADEELADPDSFVCQGRFNTRGFEAVEAMLFAMDMLNEGHLKDLVLPNVTIGMDIKDTCTSSDYAVRESLNFTFIRNANAKDECSGEPRKREQHTVAVVGAAYSGVSMAVSNLCGLFYVPLVSYASTSRLLSSKVRFRYFLRTVPSDMLQARVMADLVRAMNWNFVIALASDTEYGRSGIEAFKLALASYGDDYDICIPVDEKFTKRSDSSKFERIFRLMKANPKAKVVILFAALHDAEFLIDTFAKRDDMAKEKYVWIGSDAWADSKQVLKGNEHVLNGMLGVVPEVNYIKEFDEYFVDFNKHRRRRNPWMREYEQLKVAHDPAFHRQTFRHYPKAQYVMDAVLAVAYALHDMLGCVPREDCSKKVEQFSQRNQKDFLGYLQKVRFHGMTREIFSFDQLGDAIGVYDIHELTLVGANYEFVSFGKWGLGENCEVIGGNSTNSCLQINRNKVNDDIRGNASNQFSRCSRDCSVGFYIDPQKDHAKCCWECKQCSGNTITDKPNMHYCVRCPSGYWATQNHSSCEAISPTFLHWTDIPAVIILCISGIGLLAVICTFYVFYCFRDTPVVRASSRELCYVLLIGIGWCFVTPTFFIAEPTDNICRAIPIVTGLCPSLVVGTLLTKTNRISRIFNKKLIKTGTPSFLSKKWQLLMVLCVCLLECIICIGCVYTNDTGSRTVVSASKREVVKQCKEISDIGVAMWWAYNTGLVITCTYQAFLTRKLPENYNEAKFITFTMLTTCIVVIMFIPTYIGTSAVYRTTITCFVFIIAGIAALACMFVPKVYIILCRPEKNIPMQPRASSVRLGTISPSASFVRRLSVDLNSEETQKRGRGRRIKSLPVIKISRAEDKEEEEKVHPPRPRSASCNPDMLHVNGMIPPVPCASTPRHDRSVKVIIERIIEEVDEVESSDTESKYARESLFEAEEGQIAASIAITEKDNEEEEEEEEEEGESEARKRSIDDEVPELEATEVDRLLVPCEEVNEKPTTCTEKILLNSERRQTPGENNTFERSCKPIKRKAKQSLSFCLEVDRVDIEMSRDEKRPCVHVNDDFSKLTSRYKIFNLGTRSPATVSRLQSLVRVQPLAGVHKDRRRRKAVCEGVPVELIDPKSNDGPITRDTNTNNSNGNRCCHLRPTEKDVCPDCDVSVSCQLRTRPLSQDGLPSPPNASCCSSPLYLQTLTQNMACSATGNGIIKANGSSQARLNWLKALSGRARQGEHAQSTPSLAEVMLLCEVCQTDDSPETNL